MVVVAEVKVPAPVLMVIDATRLPGLTLISVGLFLKARGWMVAGEVQKHSPPHSRTGRWERERERLVEEKQ